MSSTGERIRKALRWRMGLIKGDEQVKHDWGSIETWLGKDSQRVDDLAAKMFEPLLEVVKWGLLRPSDVASRSPLTPIYWAKLQKHFNELQALGELPNNMVNQAANLIEAKRQQRPVAPTPDAQALRNSDAETIAVREETTASPVWSTAPAQTLYTLSEVDTVPSNRDVKQETKIHMASADPGDEPLSTGSDNQATDSQSTGTESTVPPVADPQATDSQMTDSQPRSAPGSQWRYESVPDGLDKHEEFYSTSLESPEGLKLIGARARGKKHKHEGTNCDDWFEFGVCGSWTIIAVSDGAGSKTLSRVGAKESCRAALNLLRERLGEHQIKSLENLAVKSIARDMTTGTFEAPDVEHVQLALHDAMHAAYDAVEAAAKGRAENPDYESTIGRPVAIDDLSSTLLLAAHTTVKYQDADSSFILACQVGDGMLAAVTPKGGLQLLGVPDSGEFAGQTDFLTSKKKLTREHLWRKTRGFVGPLQALMVMTDGVADDYFPNDPDMLRLYGDLVVNEVITLRGLDAFDFSQALEKTKLPTYDDVQQANFAATVEAVTPDTPRSITIRSVAEYAKQLGLEVPDVVASPALMMAAASVGQLCDEKEAEDKLRVWLDSYYVRGSFDDRTLVVLYREVVK